MTVWNERYGTYDTVAKVSVRLASSSYVILSLVERLQPATAYDLKRLAHSSVLNFWAIPHTVLYTETQRLCDAGLLSAEQEDGGRRRRRFSLTPQGLAALDGWRAEATDEFLELRDPGLLRLFAGAEPRALGTRQLRRHERQLRTYEELDRTLAAGDGVEVAMRTTLAAGIAIEREYIRFWTTVARQGAVTATAVAVSVQPTLPDD